LYEVTKNHFAMQTRRGFLEFLFLNKGGWLAICLNSF